MPASPNPRLTRHKTGGLIGGVCAGIAERYGLSVNLIRLLCVIAIILTSGLGVVAYALAWVLLPESGTSAAESDQIDTLGEVTRNPIEGLPLPEGGSVGTSSVFRRLGGTAWKFGLPPMLLLVGAGTLAEASARNVASGCLFIVAGGVSALLLWGPRPLPEGFPGSKSPRGRTIYKVAATGLVLSALIAAPTTPAQPDGSQVHDPSPAPAGRVADLKAASTGATTPPAQPTATATATALATAVVVKAELVGPPTFTVWRDILMGTRVHFVGQIVNQGTVPAEIRNIKYEMRSRTGALVEVGDIPQSYPNKIARGESAVVGRTVTADAAVANVDVATVHIRFDVVRANSPDNLLAGSNMSLRGNSLGQPIITGDVENNSKNEFDNIQTAVVLVGSDGAWLGFVTANLPVRSLKSGDKAQFVTNADLPPGFGSRATSFKIFAFDK